jgi:formate dehydrogenase/NADH-quinone oxidoreductase subunit F
MAETPPKAPGVEGRAGKFPGPSLIPALTAIQERVGWLPREELITLSREVNRPLYEIEGLVSFYPHFRTEPPKKFEVSVCHDLSCWLNGSDDAIGYIRYRCGADPDVEIVERSCIGRCDIAPALSVNEAPVTIADVVAEATLPVARDATSNLLSRPWATCWPNDPYLSRMEGYFVVEDDRPVTETHYAVLHEVLTGTYDTASLIQALKDAGLRGMGGAGFPTGRKWDLVASAPGDVKYVICNADESEPGTFKDREILARQPYLVLEGLLLGMLAVGAQDGWVFIRHEYGPEARILAAEIDRLRNWGYLGPDVMGTGKRLNVEIFTSPGGYILGEESALIECMEGHRGEPRNKPPFPGTYGLHGKPTLMNSVETFAHVPVIAIGGADWWKAQGAPSAAGATHAGLKFFSVSGHVMRPGVYCVPMGTTARTLLDLAGGMQEDRGLAAFQPGGASSNFLGPESLDVELDFATVQAAGSMLGSGAVVFMAEGTDLLAAAVNVLRFFRDESCGKCVPCRVGSAKAHAILDDLLKTGGGPADVDGTVRELATVMRRTSICGLGQVALGPVASVLALTGE